MEDVGEKFFVPSASLGLIANLFRPHAKLYDELCCPKTNPQHYYPPIPPPQNQQRQEADNYLQSLQKPSTPLFPTTYDGITSALLYSLQTLHIPTIPLQNIKENHAVIRLLCGILSGKVSGCLWGWGGAYSGSEQL